jgi:ApbE superfamily uncharacterized protein (UPF0280 family)
MVKGNQLASFQVTVKETDLHVYASRDFKEIVKDLVLKYRGVIESYIQYHPGFLKTLIPWKIEGPAPAIVRNMAEAAEKAGVGPMAAVAGAIAEHVGLDLFSHTGEVIIENGGDVFLKTDQPVTVGIFAARSPLSLTLGLRIDSSNRPAAVCTSSGSFGHSLSFGKADAVCVVSEHCDLADAAATSICNRVQSAADIETAMDFGRRIEGVKGIVIVIGDQIGFWGKMEVVPLKTKKG